MGVKYWLKSLLLLLGVVVALFCSSDYRMFSMFKTTIISRVNIEYICLKLRNILLVKATSAKFALSHKVLCVL